MNRKSPKEAKFLVVEDSEELLMIWRLFFRKLGYSAHFSTSVEDALSAVNEGYSPDVVITDYYLPELTGLDLIDQIRKRHQAVRCLLITGHTDESFIKKVKSANIEILFKPVKFAEFEDHLQAGVT